MTPLVDSVLKGERRAIARTLTLVEGLHPEATALLEALYPHTGRAWIIGITGAPGTGKSSLVSALARYYRTQGETIGILAVDPTSPFTGGAILGDRIRMRDLAGDSGVFIRSMATRGSLGGLSRATRDAARVLDAAGFDRVLVETVGAGQSEVDIVQMAHTTVVVEAPGMGDEVQAIKAGILEIADVLVVNKADRPGADQTVRGLRAMLELAHPAARRLVVWHHGKAMPSVEPSTDVATQSVWVPPILQTVAIENKGVDALAGAIESHRQHLRDSGASLVHEHQQIEVELQHRIREALFEEFMQAIPADVWKQMVEWVRVRDRDPQSAVRELLTLGREHA